MADFQVTGSIRLPVFEALKWRNSGDDEDLNVLTLNDSNVIIFGLGVPELNIRTDRGMVVRPASDTTEVFSVRNAASSIKFLVDTTNSLVRVTSGAALTLGAIPALSGALRLSNADAIVVRNQNNNADFNVISFDASANMLIGASSMPRITFATGPAIDFPSPLLLGTNPAQSGTIRLANNSSINVRNAGNNGDLNVISFDSSSNMNLGDAASPRISFPSGPVIDFPSRVALGATTPLTWGVNADVGLFRDAAWELGLRDGTNDMFFYVYGTFTDSENYERLALYAGASTNYFLEPQSAGTGTNNINMIVRQLGSGILTLGNVASGGNIDILFDNVINVIDRFNGFSRTIHKQLDASTSSGSSVTLVGAIPAGSLVLAVTARVRTAVTGPTGWDIGDGVDVDRWGNSIPVGLGNQVNIGSYTSTALTYFPTANDVVITSDGVDFTGGEIRVTIHYMNFVASSVDIS